MDPSTIGKINLLPEAEKRRIYSQVVPQALCQRFDIPPLDSKEAEDFLKFKYNSGASDMELYLYHKPGFQDPLLYGHLADTLAGQIHILLYIVNDPASPRFDVDRMPDGSMTRFGTLQRNLPAEEAALRDGLAPGQIRHGLRMLPSAIETFENFIASLGHDIYFTEPLYYHNAVLFERYGFTYQVGRRLMEQIESGFAAGGALRTLLDDSTPFRARHAGESIRLRSWAIHDGVMGGAFTNVTMYKQVGKKAGISTCPGCMW